MVSIMWTTILVIFLALVLFVYVYRCEQRRSDEFEKGESTPKAFQAESGYPVVQYPKLKFVRPHAPRFADPRVLNPKLAAAPVQFPTPQLFGSYGVTDSVATVWSDDEFIRGEARRRPNYVPKTKLPIRSTEIPQPVEADFIDTQIGTLQVGPAALTDAGLTPPGTARPMSEWAWINYGSQ